MIRKVFPLPSSRHLASSTQASLTPKALTLGLVLSLAALSGCQPAPNASDKEVSSENKPKDENGDVALETKPSPEAQAQIDAYEDKFVAQMLSLQQRLQAEYESLQAADAADHPDAQDSAITSEEGVDTAASVNTDATANTASNTNPATATDPNGPAAVTNPEAAASTTNSNTSLATNTATTPPAAPKADVNAMITNGTETGDPISLSTEVGERDLTVLKKVSLEPRAPEILDEAQIKARYRQAFAAIYKTAPLSAEDADTFINMTTLLPDLFEEPELARQLSDKSPALARLIVQHQIWRQIEAQQVKDMQNMKIAQQQEFEALLAKFNETIEGYDEQIAKYEQTLKEFDR